MVRRATLALTAALLLAPACASERPAATPPPAAVTVPPQLPATPTTPAPVYEPPPIPVAIPDDPYAQEPVIPYGSMEIPKIGLVHATYQGVTLHNIDLGPSHWTGTAAPGQPGNAVFAGHRATHSQPFRRIDELVPGDEVIFRVDGVRSTYRVTGSLVVRPQDTWIGNQTKAATATLYACHPPGSEAERYVVRMALVSTGTDGTDGTVS